MQTLFRPNHRRREDRSARAVRVPGKPIVGKGIDVVWWTGVRNRIGRNPRARARDHALGCVRVLQVPLAGSFIATVDEVGGGQTPTPSSRLWLKEADVAIVLHPIGIMQLGMGLHCGMQRSLLLELSMCP